MIKLIRCIVFLIGFLSFSFNGNAQVKTNTTLEDVFRNPPESAKPWVLWYWVYGAVSKEGITADLEGLQKNGIGGVYLACIYDTIARIPFDKPARQLSPEWWRMVNHAMKECKRLGLKMAFHVSDGFALAGGPWIKPEQSMQKLVWTKTYVNAANKSEIKLEQPETNEGFYKDVAVYAYPANSSNAFNEIVSIPSVTTSTGENASYLFFRNNESQTFRSDSACWIQYKYPQPFTLRSLTIHTGPRQFQAKRFVVQASDDGIVFNTVIKLTPSRHGWQDDDQDYTFSIPTTTAKYFRFYFNKDGTEAGSEDLDAAKWKPTLKVMGIYLSDEPVINQYQAKNGSVWRVAENTTNQIVGKESAVDPNKIINLTQKMGKGGALRWKPESGNWVIVRIGHTSTGHTNATGGAAKGLECDKFDSTAIKLQFDNWYGKLYEKTEKGLAEEVLKIFYIDSWEAGSQNWSNNFSSEFKKRRGYDLMPYLLVMTGTPIIDAATSERILHDVRETIAELVNDVFYVTLRKLADQKKLGFTAENVAPTMVSDGLLHFKTVDYPTGEFWLKSPTHDKPNDMFDAISAAHIYGKQIIQAEAFTNLRMEWNEYPGNIKIVGDRNFAMGMNKPIIHVVTHNPWMNRKPGMTLGSIGLFFQRDQVWFKQSKAWIEYMSRVSALLQQGKPVVDLAVFIGEEVPRRSILPDRLLSTLPGLFGKEKLELEKRRLENEGQPQRQIPVGVGHSANMADPEEWTDALRGYKYDCFNPDVLLKAKVKDGNVVFPSGASYKILVFPGKMLMNPNSDLMSLNVAKKILELKNSGATIIIDKRDVHPISFNEADNELKNTWQQLFSQIGKGKIVEAPYMSDTFDSLGVAKDVDVTNSHSPIAWTHRKWEGSDIYFISNQSNEQVLLPISFRLSGNTPYIWNPVDGSITEVEQWHTANERTFVQLSMAASQSVFVVFSKDITNVKSNPKPSNTQTLVDISNNWKVKFDTAFGGVSKPVEFAQLSLWNENKDSAIKFYSGLATYTRNVNIEAFDKKKPVYLTIDSIYNMASVYINGMECGTLWTKPYQLEISKALKPGNNTIEIIVSNTWANRLIGDNRLPLEKRITWTTAPMNYLENKPLLKAGLEGRIEIRQ